MYMPQTFYDSLDVEGQEYDHLLWIDPNSHHTDIGMFSLNFAITPSTIRSCTGPSTFFITSYMSCRDWMCIAILISSRSTFSLPL